MSLVGRLAFVTGAGSGIGRATCRVLAREGADIVAADQNPKNVQETINKITEETKKNTHLSLNLDVKSSESVKEALKQTLDKYKKPPTIIVNCAGITRDNFALKMSEEDFQEVIDVNLKGTFLVTQAFAQALVSHEITNAAIVNISSIMGKIPNMGQANYCASKAGVDLMSKTFAKEFGRFGIRVNSVLPGLIATPMTQTVPDKVVEKFKTFIPLARFGKPEEVAEVIAFLVSDKSSYVNGASIEVTGGF